MSEKRAVAIHTMAPNNGNYEFVNKALDGGNFGTLLKERDLDLVVSHKSSFEDGIFYRPEQQTDGSYRLLPSGVAIEGLGAVYSRIITPHQYIDEVGLQQLNPTRLKEFGGDKTNLRGLMGTLEIPTYIVGVDDLEMADLTQNDRWVLKPVSGRLAKGFQRVPSNELKIKMHEVIDDHILQPDLGVGRVPSDVHGVSKADNELIEFARSHGLPAEIRIIAIQSGDGKVITAPLMRISTNGADYIDGNDVYVDIVMQDETADLLTTETLGTIKRVSEHAGIKGQPFLVAADFLYDGERMWAMEVNLRSPTLPLTEKHPAAAKVLYPAMADTLDAMSKGGT